MSKSFKSNNSSPLSESGDPKTGCASLGCPMEEELKSKSERKKVTEESEEEGCLENSSPEV